MTLIAGVKGDEFYITMNCGAQETAKELGVTLEFQGPDKFDAAQQTPIVDAVAAKSPDAILIAPTDTKALFAPITAAAANSKIVLVDTTLEDPSMAVSQIASDNVGGGVTAGETLLELIGGKGKVMVVNVKPGISTTDQRGQGFEQAVKGKPGVEYLGQEYSQDDPAIAAADRHRDARQAPRPEGHLRHQPVLGRGRRERPARRRASSATSRSSASTPARSRSRTSRTGSCRR